VQAATSADGGRTWRTPVNLSARGQNAFGQQVSGSANGRKLTTTWIRYDGSNWVVQAATSADGGRTWSTPVNLSAPGRNADYPQVAGSADGSKLTTTWSRRDGSNSIVQAASRTLPDTRITAGTSGRVDSRKAKFWFTSTAAGSTFACRLDGGVWKQCTSAKSYYQLANGKHRVRVKATDKSGATDPTPAVQRFTTARRLQVNLKATGGGSKLKVNVNPNNKTKNYAIKVQQQKNGKWSTVRNTRTKGPRDIRIINMGEGKYRVKAPAQRDLLKDTSGVVRLSR
jgi:hypothetical protein